MPVIPSYSEKGSLEPGRAPNIRLPTAENAAALDEAQALQGLGKEAVRGATIALTLEERATKQAEQDENLKTMLGFENFRLKQQADSAKAMEGIAPDGAGFAAARLKAFDAEAGRYLQAVPDRLKDQFKQRVENQRVSFDYDAHATELKQNQGYTRDTLNKLQQVGAEDINKDPANTDPTIRKLAETIANSRLPDAEKIQRIAAMRDGLLATEAQRKLGTDAEAMAGALGRLPKGSIPAMAKDTMQYFMEKGGLTRVQAAGLTGQIEAESSFNTGARNPGDGRDGSDSLGQGQWNAERATALKAFAAARGKPWTDRATQLDFVLHELNTSEAVHGRRLRAATTIEEATAAAIGYERPKGWTMANPTAGHNWSGRLANARRVFGSGGEEAGDPRYAGLSPQIKDRLMSDAMKGQSEVERAQRSDAVQVARFVKDDIASMRDTGQGIPDLGSARVQAALGPEKAQKWEEERQQALQVYQGSAGFETMPAEAIQARVDQFRPGAADAGVGYAGKAAVYAQLQEKADGIVKARMDDPAMAVNDAPEVRAATQRVGNGGDRTANEELVAARYRAQQAVGVPDTSLAPIPVDTAKQFAARLRPLAKGQAEAVNQERIVTDVVTDIQNKYGKYGRDVLTQVLYQVTLKKDAAEVLSAAIERAEKTTSGPVILTDEVRRVEIEDQGHQIAEATGVSIDPMGGVAAPGGGTSAAPLRTDKGFDAALRLLDSDPGKYLKGFRERFGDARVPAKYREGMKPNG